MSEYLKEEWNRTGEVLRTDFFPSSDMYRFAISRASLKNNHLSDKEILKSIGLSPSRLEVWRREYGKYFEEWLVKALENFNKDVRDVMFAVGVDRALKGEYNYWKDISRTVGAISAEKVEIQATVHKGVDELAKLSPEALALEEEKLLAELIGIGSRENKENPMVTATSGEEPSGSENRDSPLQAEPLALPDKLDKNRRRPRQRKPTQTIP